MRSIQSIALCASLVAAAPAFSQHHGARTEEPRAASMAGQTSPNPYAGQQAREIKSLSASQVQDMLAGKGMELAKAAELNGYPGPMHTLELADPMQLTPDQRSSTEQLLVHHKSEARALGAQLVNAERQLDQAFASRQINPEALATATQRIGALQAALRRAHLETHLQQTSLLTPQQVARYNQLRGYDSKHSSTHPN